MPCLRLFCIKPKSFCISLMLLIFAYCFAAPRHLIKYCEVLLCHPGRIKQLMGSEDQFMKVKLWTFKHKFVFCSSPAFSCGLNQFIYLFIHSIVTHKWSKVTPPVGLDQTQTSCKFWAADIELSSKKCTKSSWCAFQASSEYLAVTEWYLQRQPCSMWLKRTKHMFAFGQRTKIIPLY